VERLVLQPLTPEQRARLDGLLQVDPELRTRTRLSWLREAPELPSAKSLRKVLDRLAYLRALDLPTPDRRLHPNRLRQLAGRCGQYAAQPLARFAADQRYCLLGAYLPDLAASLTDQALDMLDKILEGLVRKGKKKKGDKKGDLHLTALDAVVPDVAKQLQRRLERRIPLISLPDLLNEVDRWTGCFRHFTHLVGGEVPEEERRQMLIAAVMALGMNHGLGRLARSTPFSYRQLAWAADWHIREETLRAALVELDQFVLRHPLARYWGAGTRSASDGVRVRVGVKAANADRNAAYFGPGRGVTIYGHTADFRLPFHTQVISTNDREALYVIDGLCNHETDLNIQEHFTDTNGYTTHVFGLCAALGFRFAPRIRDVLDQRLFTIGRPEHDYGPFNQLLTDRINTRLIVDNWDEVLRLAASIRHGTVSAALIMRKLAAYPRQNQVARALNEIG
jgi:TnpA family transposase